jgi:hypothetical protein|tara:strand:+ start:496 stop:837 length:342 start_codon:yes stop_codon:yes gene_type:complete
MVFKKKNKLPKFDYVEDPTDPGKHAIRIDEGPYKGIVYTYGIVGFEESEEEDNLHIPFSYDIINNPNRVDVLEDEDFHSIMSRILNCILTYNVKRQADARESRENNTDEFSNK